jgi:hypothetical protein
VELLLELDLFFVVRLGLFEQQLFGEIVLRADHCKASTRELRGMSVSGLYAHVKKVSRCHYMSKQQFRSGLHPYDVIEYATHPSVITRVAKARNPLTRPSQHPLGCVFQCRVRPVRGERFDQLQRVLMKMASKCIKM